MPENLFMNGIQRHLPDVDAANDASFSFPLFEGIDAAVEIRVTGIFARDTVQLLHHVIRDDFHFTTELDVTSRILRVHDEHGYFRVSEHIAALLTFQRCIDANAFAVIIAPYQA